MKKIYFLSVLLIGFLFSCSQMDEANAVEENEAEKEAPKEKSSSGYVYDDNSKLYIIPFWEEWKYKEGAMPESNLYDVYFTTSPYDPSPNEGDPYPNYAAIIWDKTNYMTSTNIHQFSIQLQYRKSREGVPNDWQYAGPSVILKDGILPCKDYGIYKLTELYKALNINSLDLPYGSIDIRFRIIHDSSYPALPYENNISRWCEPRTWENNPYGYGNPDVEYNSDIIKINVTLPSRSDYSYDYAILFNNSFYPIPTGALGYYHKITQIGTVKVTARRKMLENSQTVYRSAIKYADYNQSSTELNFSFSDGDF